MEVAGSVLLLSRVLSALGAWSDPNWGRGRVLQYCKAKKVYSYIAPKFCKINFCTNVYSVKYSYRNTNIILFDLFLLKRLHPAVHFNL